MDHVRVTRAAWVRLAFYTCVLATTAGVFLEFGLGVALMVGGVVGALSALTLHDVDPPKGR